MQSPSASPLPPDSKTGLAGKLALYKELSKSGIVALVLISVLGGYLIGQSAETHLDLGRMFLTLIGVLFLASGSSALNQLQEWKIDAEMPRTAKRPLPSGRMSKLHVGVFVTVGVTLGWAILHWLSPALGLLGLLAVVLYNGLYTLWWKKRWAYAAVPGAIPGALPILMGYASASGEVFNPAGIYLFFILFFWQMPHFWVLALKFTEDYRQGGIPTLPVALGDRITRFQITLWGLAYIALALIGPLFLKVGFLYLAITLATSIKLLYELRFFAKQPDNKSWLRFFLWINFSLILFVGAAVVDLWSIYLPAVR